MSIAKRIFAWVMVLLCALYIASVIGRHPSSIVNRSVLFRSECAREGISISVARSADGRDRIEVAIKADPLFTEFNSTQLIVGETAVERERILEIVAPRNSRRWTRSVIETKREKSFFVEATELPRSFVVIRFDPVSRFLPATTKEFAVPMVEFK
jgi:hypothetical protein